jgi:hypothetical protein
LSYYFQDEAETAAAPIIDNTETNMIALRDICLLSLYLSYFLFGFVLDPHCPDADPTQWTRIQLSVLMLTRLRADPHH